VDRLLTFGCANSLDNFIARRDHSVDWLMWSDEVAALTAGFWKTIDTVLMGRKTYEAAVRAGQTGGYSGVKTFVFSRTLETVPSDTLTLVNEDVREFVRRLKAEGGKGLCLMGGGELAQPLFEAGLVDQVGVNIHPVLLGDGIPLFRPMPRQLNLELKEHRVLTNGCVYLLYSVRYDAAGRN
jgi:dihydrofolate reductase